MNPHEARDERDDWLVHALRQHAALQEVADEGFSARVAAALPPRPVATASRPRWSELAVPAGLGVSTTVFLAQWPALASALDLAAQAGWASWLQSPQNWLPAAAMLTLTAGWSWWTVDAG